MPGAAGGTPAQCFAVWVGIQPCSLLAHPFRCALLGSGPSRCFCARCLASSPGRTSMRVAQGGPTLVTLDHTCIKGSTPTAVGRWKFRERPCWETVHVGHTHAGVHHISAGLCGTAYSSLVCWENAVGCSGPQGDARRSVGSPRSTQVRAPGLGGVLPWAAAHHAAPHQKVDLPRASECHQVCPCAHVCTSAHVGRTALRFRPLLGLMLKHWLYACHTEGRARPTHGNTEGNGQRHRCEHASWLGGPPAMNLLRLRQCLHCMLGCPNQNEHDTKTHRRHDLQPVVGWVEGDSRGWARVKRSHLQLCSCGLSRSQHPTTHSSTF